MGDDTRAGLAQFLVVGERMQVVRGVDLLKLLQRIILIGHDFGLSSGTNPAGAGADSSEEDRWRIADAGAQAQKLGTQRAG
ncbi:hypothetical protein GCM10007880_55070 [Mesorhizobium amorphae]|nr:hypothetical protein GCM10007880_55070 [Mesorhizobium amorphae]